MGRFYSQPLGREFFGPEVDDHQLNSRDSGGDMLPWMFITTKIGKRWSGKRTWGGWSASGGYPPLHGRRQCHLAELVLALLHYDESKWGRWEKQGDGWPDCRSGTRRRRLHWTANDPQLERAPSRLR